MMRLGNFSQLTFFHASWEASLFEISFHGLS